MVKKPSLKKLRILISFLNHKYFKVLKSSLNLNILNVVCLYWIHSVKRTQLQALLIHHSLSEDNHTCACTCICVNALKQICLFKRWDDLQKERWITRQQGETTDTDHTHKSTHLSDKHIELHRPHAHTHVHTHTHTHSDICTQTCTPTHRHVHTHKCTHTHTHTHRPPWHMQTHTYSYTLGHMHTHIYTYTCTYTHALTQLKLKFVNRLVIIRHWYVRSL